jgi:hypothetical protein
LTTDIGTPPRNEGRVQVFDYDGTSWSRTLNDEGGIAGRYGYSVDITADGSTFVAGNPNYPGNGGALNVARKTGSTWNYVDGDTGPSGYRLGTHVSISDDGSAIAASARHPDFSIGQAQAYAYTFDGAALSDPTVIDVGTHQQSDWPPVALSGDGNLLAAGANSYDNNTGAVFVYAFDGSSWNSQATILGTGTGMYEGSNVAFSSSGSTLAITAAISDGQTRVFTRDGSDWNQRGDTFAGSDAQSLGDGLAFANDGSTIAIGSPSWYNADPSIDNRTGRVQVFSWPIPPATGDAIPGPATYFSFYLTDGRECTSISPQRVQVGTFVELPGTGALCQTTEESARVHRLRHRL